MIKKLLAEILILSTFAVFAVGQDPTPTPAASAAQIRMAQLQEQIDLLKKQQDYEKAKMDLENQRIKNLLDAVKSGNAVSGNKAETKFTPLTTPNPESEALSYVALAELSKKIVPILEPIVRKYKAIVIYNEPDFLGLAKYYVYRTQSETALADYKDWRKNLEDYYKNRPDVQLEMEVGKTRSGLATGLLSAPAIAAGFAGSVGELLSLFRTETLISESSNTVDDDSLGTAMANELSKANSDLKIIYPRAFMPEYDVEADGKDTILNRITEINMAFADVSEFLSRRNEFPAAELKQQELKDLLAEAEEVKSHLGWLVIVRQKVGGQTRGAGDDDPPVTSISDLRQLVRGEKLNRFMRQGATTLGSEAGPKVGIMRLRSLASGGSRRETRNLFLGNKIRYSGTVTLEVLLFDVDGRLRISEIFSGHTGFRKLNE